MLSTILFLLSSAMCILAQTSIQFGPYYSLGATTSYIVEAETTLYPGDTPSPQQDRLALWPGMGTDDGGLIQSIVLSVADPSAECGAEAGEWCTFASLYTGTQQSGSESPVSAGEGVTINYLYVEGTDSYTQTVTVSGKVVSTLTSSVGKAIGWGTAVECQDECSGTVNAHSYKNTTIRLAAADTAFGDTLATNLATATDLTTSDSITWKVEDIEIQEPSFVAGAGSARRF